MTVVTRAGAKKAHSVGRDSTEELRVEEGSEGDADIPQCQKEIRKI